MAITKARKAGIEVVTVPWTCDSAGDAAVSVNLDGLLMRTQTIPGATSFAPTTLYDLTVLDADTFDVLGGMGADRSATVVETIDAFTDTWMDRTVSGLHTMTIANAGSLNTGTVRFYLQVDYQTK